MRNSISALAAALLVGASAPMAATAADLLVPEQLPNISSAVSLAASGDRVLVGPGVYTEAMIFFAGKNVLVESREGPESTILAFGGQRIADIGPGAGFVGFTFRGAATAPLVGMVVRGAGTRLESNIFDGTGDSGPGGMLILGNVASPIIEGNRFRGIDCADAPGNAVLSFNRGSAPTIRNNLFHDNDCAAVALQSAFGSAPLVANNTLVRNRIALQVVRDTDASAQQYRNNLLTQNVIGLLLASGSRALDPAWDHNLVYGNATDYSEHPDPTGARGNLSADPQLVDSAAGDFHLQPGSPAVDAGSDQGAPASDLEGTPRPQDGDLDGVAVADIGAFEVIPPPPTVEPDPAPSGAVEIAVRPFSRRPWLRPFSPGLVSLAILASDGACPRGIEQESLALGPDGAQPVHRRVKRIDVNRDGKRDAVVFFRTRDTGVRPGDSEICLTGELDGTAFQACAEIETRRPWRSRRRHRDRD